ncbi:prolyl oligopeptidase family serine peptidase [Sandarakinorhabdus limnophila]|uniref:prolyl oligopeptidase family serine peptidase n=1 Tax=Sandarakinorhabdus limnophila TaxID=210512 RepID=UPI0026E9B9F2|nr:prolyl oligopeptidase family serine peptidase [Sandarakinorhabdus limnophila]
MMMSTAASVVAAPIAYPETQRGFEVEARHGLSVPDPYRWLEADVRTDANVAKWVDTQNKVTMGYLAGLPKRETIRQRLTELYNYERFGIPRVRSGVQFFTRNSGLQNQSVLYVQAPGAEPRVLIDPNPWAKDGATALAEWTPSKDGKHLAYAVQDGGTDWRTIKVMNVATGIDLADSLEGVKYTGEVAWRPDGSGFYYSRFPAPPAGQKYQSATLNEAIWFHKLGTPQSADTKVFATPDRPKLGHHAQLSEDGRWMVVSSSESSGGNAVFIADLSKGETPRAFVSALDKEWGFAGSQGGTLYFVTNKDAPRYQLLAVDGASGSGKPVVPEGAATLTGGAVVGKRLVVETLEDAKSVVRLYETDGKPVGVVPLPGIDTAGGFQSSDDGKTWFAFSSFATPGSIWRYDAATNTAEVVRQAKVAFNPADYTVSQVFYPSKDGTKVPMFVAHRKDVDVSKPHPTLLYAYGGFNISSTPGFSVSRLVWMEMGGVFAVANIRGGGEYGAAWHDGGRLLNKQNVFDDFIAAGEALIQRGLTTKGQLAIQGGSNGGLLVGAVTNQRPDLFAAALPAVGVMDMLRYANWTAGRYWVDDYGDMNKSEMFRYNLGFSPYHNVKGGKAYPAILVTTADTDDRVVPSHSFKYAAALQAAPIGDKPHLIRIETRAGHGSGKPTDKIIAEAADLSAFAGYWTGLTK